MLSYVTFYILSLFLINFIIAILPYYLHLSQDLKNLQFIQFTLNAVQASINHAQIYYKIII